MSTEQVTPGLVEPQGIGEEPLFFMTRAYLVFLQNLFAQNPSGSYRFSEDEKLTQISITDQAPIPKDRIGQRPHIITMRGPAQFANLSLDQMETVDARTGMKIRRDLVACTMTLNCIAKNGVEAQRIAWEVMSLLRTFKVDLQREAHMHKIADEISMGPESPPGSFVQGEADPEWVLITVQSPFFFMWKQKVSPLSEPLLRKIQMQMRAQIPDPATLSTEAAARLRAQISSPTIRGRVISTVSEFPSAPIDLLVET